MQLMQLMSLYLKERFTPQFFTCNSSPVRRWQSIQPDNPNYTGLLYLVTFSLNRKGLHILYQICKHVCWWSFTWWSFTWWGRGRPGGCRGPPGWTGRQRQRREGTCTRCGREWPPPPPPAGTSDTGSSGSCTPAGEGNYGNTSLGYKVHTWLFF